MSDSTVGPRAEDVPSPEEPRTATDVALQEGKEGALRWLKDTSQKDGFLNLRGNWLYEIDELSSMKRVEEKYAGIQVWAVPGAPVDEVYLIDLEKLPSLDMQMLLDEVKASLTSDLGAVMEDLLVRGRADIGPPSPNTFARDLERFVMNTVPEEHRTARETNVIEKHQRAVCSMSTIRAALDGFGEPPSGPPCFICDATPCICGRAL